ncbi:hypothetical protein IE53DRAFT_390925 [Violaceomyces palustris]|uniref:Uncharacterized protein n=1 Tax=Violaceomyces palustris TaxID=1673888 RepID=A0ACD0NMA1_9BASI|nr:hypothetical protein IE53DRAFT_390925 [Violaceomyces palustris]
MVDTVGMGYTERRKINVEIVEERMSYREGFKKMIESVKRPFAEMEALVRKGESFLFSRSPLLLHTHTPTETHRRSQGTGSLLGVRFVDHRFPSFPLYLHTLF